MIMIYLFSFIYLLIGLAIGVTELRVKQQYLPDNSNSAWWCIPLYLVLWLPILIILLIVIIIAQFNKHNIR